MYATSSCVFHFHNVIPSWMGCSPTHFGGLIYAPRRLMEGRTQKKRWWVFWFCKWHYIIISKRGRCLSWSITLVQAWGGRVSCQHLTLWRWKSRQIPVTWVLQREWGKDNQVPLEKEEGSGAERREGLCFTEVVLIGNRHGRKEETFCNILWIPCIGLITHRKTFWKWTTSSCLFKWWEH